MIFWPERGFFPGASATSLIFFHISFHPMELETAINGRRAVREYQGKEVPKEAIEKILHAGAMAPSAMDRQPCRFIVIADKKKILELSKKVVEKAAASGAAARIAERAKTMEDPIFYGAPLLVLIVAEKGKWATIDCSLAAQNMLLMAYSLGLGSNFIGYATMMADDRKLLSSFGIEDSQDLICPLIFGYPKQWPEAKVRGAKVQKEY